MTYGLSIRSIGLMTISSRMSTAADAKRHREAVHQAYIDALNALVADNSELAGKTVEELLRGIDDVPRTIHQRCTSRGRPQVSVPVESAWPVKPARTCPVNWPPKSAEPRLVARFPFGVSSLRRTDSASKEDRVFLSLSGPLTGSLEINSPPGNGSVCLSPNRVS